MKAETLSKAAILMNSSVSMASTKTSLTSSKIAVTTRVSNEHPLAFYLFLSLFLFNCLFDYLNWQSKTELHYKFG